MFQAVIIVTLGIGSQWLAWRFKVPAIILLCVAGVTAGPVLGWINPSRDLGELSSTIVRLAVAIILFDGGLALRNFEFKQARSGIRRLVLAGLPLSWILGSLAAHFIAGLSWGVSILLGAILVVTGPTVIIPLIRQVRLTPRIASLLKWEGIVNDPLGALLAVLVFEYLITTDTVTSPTLQVIWSVASALAVSALLGVGVGYAIRHAFRRSWVPEFLKVPVILSFIIVIFGLANSVQNEAGLLAVTIFGFVLGNVGLRITDELRHFKEILALFLVSAVFIILTADLNVSDLRYLNWRTAAFLLTLLFVVRPLAVWLATINSGMDKKDRILLGWIAPRGVVAASVSGLFAPTMYAAGYVDAQELVPIVFAVVFLTVVVHGLTLPILAKRLGLAITERRGLAIVGVSPWILELAEKLREAGVRLMLIDNSWYGVREARLRGFNVYFGEILSDESEEKLDLSETFYLLAATENDAYNALICSTFGTRLGREHVFQLPMHIRPRSQKTDIGSEKRGRIVFGKDKQYEVMMSLFDFGWDFQTTPITEKFNIDELRKSSNQKVEPLILVKKDKRLVFRTEDNDLEPQPGDTLISFVSPN